MSGASSGRRHDADGPNGECRAPVQGADTMQTDRTECKITKTESETETEAEAERHERRQSALDLTAAKVLASSSSMLLSAANPRCGSKQKYGREFLLRSDVAHGSDTALACAR